jgi:hypothetical protein
MQDRDLLPDIPDIHQSANNDLLSEIPDVKENPLFSGFQPNVNNGKQPLYRPNFLKQIIEGINEGGTRGARAVLGKETPLPELPQGEWEKGGRETGRFIGGVAPMAGVGAGIAMTGGLAGLPAAEAAGAFGGGFAATPGNVVERGIAGAKNLLPMALLKIPGLAKALFTKYNPDSMVHAVQKGHDVLEKEASDAFNLVKDQIKQRNIGMEGKPNISPGEHKLIIDQHILDEAEDMLAKTRANKKLIENARSGDYDAIHKLQSDLGKKGRKKLSADSGAENDEGEEMLDTRSKINETIENTLRSKGHNDLADELKKGRDLWHRLKELYYSRPSIAQMVDPELRLIPSNAENIFSEKSKPMTRIHEAHPEIPETLELIKNKNTAQKLIKAGKYGAKASGLIGGGYLLGKSGNVPDLTDF